MADFVAELVGGHVWRNNRIKIACATNQSCAARRSDEPMLRAAARKILLQQYLPIPDLLPVTASKDTFALSVELATMVA